MVYRSIGLMSGSSLDGLDIAMVEFEEVRGKWSFRIEAAATLPYSELWLTKLKEARTLSAQSYLELHSEYGHFIGKMVNAFIKENNLDHRVQLIVSHGHTTFHLPSKLMTAQLGDGSAIAAETGINVISDLRSLDVALGGQGAPIVPLGEKYLFSDYALLLNLGGIANISIHQGEQVQAFDICSANRILNTLALQMGLEYDAEGKIAASGQVNTALLTKLNALDYYKLVGPKSLANEFGLEEVLPIIHNVGISVADALRTYVEHIALQVGYTLSNVPDSEADPQMLVSGGGAFNSFLLERIAQIAKQYNVTVVKAENDIIKYKEAIIMAFLGILRWREENTVLASVTGAKRSSIGGAVWIGQEY